MNIVIIKEFLTIRLELDLNYIDIGPVNIAMFGWDSEEPVIITFSAKESKILNCLDDDVSTYSFQKMWN